MREAHPRERTIGISHYASETAGVGGQLRDTPKDFRVRERGDLDPEALDADPSRFRHLLVRATLENWDTHTFASDLSDRLGISRGRVAWAGTKDKRAVTTQLFSIEDVDETDLPSMSSARIEPIGRLGRRLHLGDLAGNEFEIVVRDPKHPEHADEITVELREFGGLEDVVTSENGTHSIGVPNFFGQQRFGSRRPITHEVGRAIVRREWKSAVVAYVANPFETEPTETREARSYIEETLDWQGGLARMPEHMGYERAMLHHLAALDGEPTPEDYREALCAVPENLQRLFVHAAQSYAFNWILSERMQRALPFDRAVPGDVVCFGSTHEDLVVPDTDRLQRVTEDRVETVNRHIERGRAFVTAPLVGTETHLGDGEPGDIEREVLADLELSADDFALPEPFSSSGTRRSILVRTDLHPSRDPLTFSFSLPKGSYATVVLREYLKTAPDSL